MYSWVVIVVVVVKLCYLISELATPGIYGLWATSSGK